MTLPAARQGDIHNCPTHGPSPITAPCCPTVLIGNQLAARQGDFAVCPGGPDAIVEGSPTVLIGGKPAARMNEKFAHGGAVAIGMPTVLIGNPPVGLDGRAIPIPPECAFLRDFGKKATGEKLDRLRDVWSQNLLTQVYVEIPGDTSET